MRDPFLSPRRLDQSTAKVREALSKASPEIRLRLQAELDRFRQACGCGTGSVVALLTFLGMGLWQVFAFTHFHLLWMALAIGKILAATMLSALLGKLLGLGLARARFRRVTHRLLEEIHV